MTQSNSRPPLTLSSDAMVVVGKLGRPYGVRGWQVLHSFTEPAKNLFSYAPWYLQTSSGASWTEITNHESRPHKDAFIAQINGICDRDEAQALTGALIGVPRGVIPDPEQDEYFWHDLIGCQVKNLQDQVLGEVMELMETGAHAVLCIGSSQPKGNHLVPFTEQYLQLVDPAQKQIIVDWQADWS